MSWLDTLTENTTRDFGIEAPRALMAALGNPQDKVRSIHVAGTNGKGSTCSYLASLINGAGYKTGQFLSPHLTHVTERCVIDGEPVIESLFDKALEEVKSTGLKVSYFEAVFAASVLIFNWEKVDYAIIETGLGGRLDATNTILKPEATVITSVSLDHEELLGKTIEKIAWEKAHIAKRGVPMFSACKLPVVKEVVEKEGGFLISETPAPLSLPAYQGKNAALASQVFEYLFDTKAEHQWLERVKWPGRFEQIGNILIDGAHNIGGVSEFLRHAPRGDFIFGSLEHKRWKEMGSMLPARHFYCNFSHPKALKGEVYRQEFPEVEVVESPAEILSMFSGQVNCLGSLYFIGELRGLLNQPFKIF